MKVLITSGGTKVPIDLVRDITNMSTGTFGSKIATEILKKGHEVIFLRAKGSKSPLSVTVDLVHEAWTMERMEKWFDERSKFAHNYRELVYRTFNDYAEILERAIKIYTPDIIVLAAAVSDYGVEKPVAGKVRLKKDFTITLSPLPKLIGKIKTWAPNSKLVGFKLLVGSRPSELILAAKDSIDANGCDMVVANDLQDIKDGKHKLTLVFPRRESLVYLSDPTDPNFLAKMVETHLETLSAEKKLSKLPKWLRNWL